MATLHCELATICLNAITC